MKKLLRKIGGWLALAGLGLGVLVFIAICVVAFGGAVGLFFGAILWVFQKLVGPLSCDIPDQAIPWICLAIVGCALAAGLGRRSRR